MPGPTDVLLWLPIHLPHTPATKEPSAVVTSSSSLVLYYCDETLTWGMGVEGEEKGFIRLTGYSLSPRKAKPGSGDHQGMLLTLVSSDLLYYIIQPRGGAAHRNALQAYL